MKRIALVVLMAAAEASCGDSNQSPPLQGTGGDTSVAGWSGSGGFGGGGAGGVAGTNPVPSGGAGSGALGGVGGAAAMGGYAGGWSIGTPPCPVVGPVPPPVRLKANASLLIDGELSQGMRLYAGDLNGDGEPDLAVAVTPAFSGSGASNPSQISVRLNAGGGAFGAPVAYPLSGYVSAMAGGDLNGDGTQDLVAALRSGSVSVLLNHGDGTFAPAVDYSRGADTGSVALGDLDGDGDLDVVVTASDGSAIRLMNAGDGTLGPAIQELADPQGVVTAVATGDLDGDGHADVVAAISQDTLVVRASRTLAISTVATNGPFDDFAVGDLNGDGIPDLVTAGPEEVTVLMNQGQAAFVPGGTYPAAAWIALADMTGDGRTDIVTVGTDVTTVLVNDGGGLFHDAYPDGYAPLYGPASAADLDGDGSIDLVAPHYGGASGTVDVALNRGGGALIPGLEAGPVTGSPFAMILGDLDGDGDLDVAVSDRGNGGLTLLLNVGDGTFTPGFSLPIGAGLTGMAAGDLDGDGDLDLVVDGNDVVYVLANDGTGAFTPTAYPAGDGEGSVAIADLNGDGAPDFVVGTAGAPSIDVVTAGQLSVFLNDGNGSFTRTGIWSEHVLAVALGDVNGDGAIDLVTGNQYYTSLHVRLNDGQGNLGPATNYDNRESYLSPIGLDDLNGDGRPDLTIRGTVALNDGASGFFSPVTYGISGGLTVAGDLNGDGRLDLVQSTTGITVLVNQGCGVFEQGPSYAMSGHALAIGDMNADGKPDVVVLRDGGVSVVLSESP